MWDIEELACKMLGLSEEEASTAIGNQTIGDKFLDEFEVDLEQLEHIVREILPLVPPIKSPLSGKIYHALVDSEGCAVVKVEQTSTEK